MRPLNFLRNLSERFLAQLTQPTPPQSLDALVFLLHRRLERPSYVYRCARRSRRPARLLTRQHAPSQCVLHFLSTGDGPHGDGGRITRGLDS